MPKKQIVTVLNDSSSDFRDIYNAARYGDGIYVDKTAFIREWFWRGEKVMMITRPHRFGKTLVKSEVDYFFNRKYKDVRDMNGNPLFAECNVWEDNEIQAYQGFFPVISLSFAGCEGNYSCIVRKICDAVSNAYRQFRRELLDSQIITPEEKAALKKIMIACDPDEAPSALKKLTEYLSLDGQKPVILLDEYDCPFNEAFNTPDYDKVCSFMTSLLCTTFKDNEYLERGLIFGITKVERDSMFSSFNNVIIDSMESAIFPDAFGYCEREVENLLQQSGILKSGDRTALEKVKKWYNGYNMCFANDYANALEIYNPWSINAYVRRSQASAFSGVKGVISVVPEQKRVLPVFSSAWADSSNDKMASETIYYGDSQISADVIRLICGESIDIPLEKNYTYRCLMHNHDAFFATMFAAGLLKVTNIKTDVRPIQYSLTIPNEEVREFYHETVKMWSDKSTERHIDTFVQALYACDIDGMKQELETLMGALDDTARSPKMPPENIYHGILAGLCWQAREEYRITSHRPSDVGRYDLSLIPLPGNVAYQRGERFAYCLEFKIADSATTLKTMSEAAISQIYKYDYLAMFRNHGIPEERIKCYGFAFSRKQVCITDAADVPAIAEAAKARTAIT